MDTPKRKRRWFKYTVLATLILLMVVIMLGIGAFHFLFGEGVSSEGAIIGKSRVVANYGYAQRRSDTPLCGYPHFSG